MLKLKRKIKDASAKNKGNFFKLNTDNVMETHMNAVFDDMVTNEKKHVEGIDVCQTTAYHLILKLKKN